MRYFISIIPPANVQPKDVPDSLGEAMGPWIERSVASGALISTGGLMPSGTGKRLNGATGKVAQTDGPFAEAKEVVGGYAVVEATDQAAATAFAADFLQMHIDNGMPDITLEVRAIAGGYNY